jgi:hypothetical protein
LAGTDGLSRVAGTLCGCLDGAPLAVSRVAPPPGRDETMKRYYHAGMLTTGLTNWPSIVLITDYELYANNYNKVWCFLKNKKLLLFYAKKKKDTNKWCDMLPTTCLSGEKKMD